MDRMRDVLKKSLRRSLSPLSDEDRLAASWPVACGPTLAKRGTLVGHVDGVVRVEVPDEAWIEQMRTVAKQLEADLAQISGVKVIEIHFSIDEQGG